MSYTLRTYRHRNPKGGDDKKTKSPFFKGIQRLATSKEDEKLATHDARMGKDKEEPMKPVQLCEKEEKPVQKMDKPGEEKKKKKPKGAGSEVKKTDKKAGEKKQGEKGKEKPVQRKEK